jgi:transposase
VKSERLDWLADNPLYTKRFAFYVGRRCRETPIKEVAQELFLDGHTVKELDKQYLREQLRRAGSPAPRVIGIDEIAIAKGHQYRIVVSDLERGRAIWFGGKGRSEASLDEFFAWLGLKKCSKIRLAVMDMWKAFRNSTVRARRITSLTRFVGCRLALFHREKPHACTLVRSSGSSFGSCFAASLAATPSAL